MRIYRNRNYYNSYDDIYNYMNYKCVYDEKRLGKITTYLPSGAIVGKLFEHPEKQKIIHSECTSLYQHDVFSWEIIGKEFVYEKIEVDINIDNDECTNTRYNNNESNLILNPIKLK